MIYVKAILGLIILTILPKDTSKMIQEIKDICFR